ncbi:MAG: hypothetical protein JWM85_2537, partial [Acidimicrobiaceae bacterium]|nr:hypothetical protein [Acidimicrobiaceae bacterium]
MTEDSTVLFVGLYASKADAEADYDAIKTLDHAGEVRLFDAAIITKGPDGRVRLSTDEEATRNGTVVGAVVGILFPPFLVADVAAGAMIGHLWGGMSRADMKDLGELLDSGDIALVVVAESSLQRAVADKFTRAHRKLEKHVKADPEQLRKELE